jgi:hypothetical protein
LQHVDPPEPLGANAVFALAFAGLSTMGQSMCRPRGGIAPPVRRRQVPAKCRTSRGFRAMAAARHSNEYNEAQSPAIARFIKTDWPALSAMPIAGR